LQFSPRLRDLGGQRLYRIDRSIRYEHIGPLLRGTLRPEMILKHWDDLLRVAGSLKMGWVTASTTTWRTCRPPDSSTSTRTAATTSTRSWRSRAGPCAR
jgi:TnpA family transposase